METTPDCSPIDAHCHVAWDGFIPQPFIDGVVENTLKSLRAYGIPADRNEVLDLYHRKLQDPLCDELAAEMKAAGIQGSVLLIPDFTYSMGCQLTIEEIFLRHCTILERHPGSFVVFGGVDPRWGRDGVVLFERSVVEFGFRGLKVYPPCGFNPSDPMMDPFYELCDTYTLPVVVHIGPTSPALSFDTSHPFLLDGACRKFPRVTFILAHGAVSFVEESVMMCAFRPNVYLDLSAIQGTFRQGGMYGSLRDLLSRRINHKIIFGSDWPLFRLRGTQQAFLDSLLGPKGPLAGLNERDVCLILRENILRASNGSTVGAQEAFRSLSGAAHCRRCRLQET
jgi:predicted TIM-barrel fold metal-dependent hydrolase